jgi:F-type H+-transporting ATPase subunit b
MRIVAFLSPFEGAGFNWHALIVQALGFAILAVILGKLVVPVVRKMLGERSKAIEDKFSQLDRDVEETKRQVADYGQRLARIDEETGKRIQAAMDEGARSRAALLEEALAQAQAETEKARRDIQMERDKAILELRDTVISATERLVDGMMNEQLHGRIVEKSLGSLERAVRRP